MKIAVCVKHAVDEAELKVDQSGSPVLAGSASKVSTFDKNAVEEALKLKSSQGGEVVVFTVGPADARKSMKEALAMGADRGVLVVAEATISDTLHTASLLAGALSKAGPFDAIFCSEGSSDTYSGQVPPMLAELMALPYAGYVRKLVVSQGKAVAERSLEESVEAVEMPVPFIASVVSEINEPRYPTLIQIMQASKKPVEELPAALLPQAQRASSTAVVSMVAHVSNRKKLMIGGTPEDAAAKLLEALDKEGVLPR